MTTKSFINHRVLWLLIPLLTLFSINVWGTDYELVTSTSALEAGAKYLIGDGTSGTVNFMSTTSKSGNRPTTSASVTNNKVTLASGMMPVTLGGTTGAWTFYTNGYLGSNGSTTGDGYLNATSTTGSNTLNVLAAIDDYAYFTIAFSSNNVVITCTGKTSRNIMLKNSSIALISCYSSFFIQ